MDIGNMHKNVVKIGCVIPKIGSRTDKHRHTERDTLITILLSPTRGGVTSHNVDGTIT